MITASIDSGMVMTNIRALQSVFDEAVPKAALDVGFEILRLSQIEVPHDEGSLQNSGTVEVVNGDVVIGYHEPYAARLHEHPEYHFQKGRKGKYLTDPIIRNAKVLGLRLGGNLKDEVGR